ncbi:MAG TPA: hypothetical protein VFB72_06930, partial [Verrucomicrobiae bacterium]|nr:hypothetical protein [Verrucomicrobiae bacterium]
MSEATPPERDAKKSQFTPEGWQIAGNAFFSGTPSGCKTFPEYSGGITSLRFVQPPANIYDRFAAGNSFSHVSVIWHHGFIFRVLVLSVLLVIFFGSAVLAEPPEQIAAQLARRALTDSNAMLIVTDLTTRIGPRLDGSEAEKRAAAWAKARFEQLGFDKVWIEPFELAHGWQRGEERAEVISPVPQPLAVTALGGSPATPPEGVTAEIALFKTYDALLAAPPGSLTGKIAVVTQPMVRAQDGAGYGEANKIRTSG